MTTDLRLVVRREEAVLVRVLGLVVRRGFEPVRVQASIGTDGKFKIELSLEGERSIKVLARQLARLNEVEQIEIIGQPAEQ